MSRVRAQVIDSMREMEDLVDVAPHLFIPEPPERPESDGKLDQDSEFPQNGSPR